MIRRDVQNRRHRRSKRRDMVELKTAHLQHHDCAGGQAAHHLRERRADISCDGARDTRIGEHSSCKRRRGRLAVCSGDRDDRRAAEPARKLKLADDRNATPDRLLQQRCIGPDARTDHQHIRIEHAVRVVAEFELRPHAPELRCHGSHCLFAVPVAQEDLRSVRNQQLCRRHSAARSSEDAETPSPNILFLHGRYRTLNVARLTIIRTTATM